MAAVVVFTLSPVEFRLVTRAPADLERFMAFAASSGALCIGYPRYRLGIALLVLGTVGLLEVAQHLVPSRHGHLHDSIVKASGAFAGAVMAMLVDRRKVVP